MGSLLGYHRNSIATSPSFALLFRVSIPLSSCILLRLDVYLNFIETSCGLHTYFPPWPRFPGWSLEFILGALRHSFEADTASTPNITQHLPCIS